MDPILRRSSFFYITGVVTYLGLMGRYFLTRRWPVFEIIPLFMPIWLASALIASEQDECYAFLRMLPVTDRAIVRRKFLIILASAAIQWGLIVLVAALRTEDGTATAGTFVYLTLVCAAGLVIAGGLQVAVWRFGLPAVRTPAIVAIAVTIAVLIGHTLALMRVEQWFAFSELGPIAWMATVPWLSSAAVAVLALAAWHRIMQVGIRVKASSEAHL
jgi:hypothetical protein